jgi:hypothetical protein
MQYMATVTTHWYAICVHCNNTLVCGMWPLQQHIGMQYMATATTYSYAVCVHCNNTVVCSMWTSAVML